MSTYLATTTFGKFDLDIFSVGGIPSYVAVDPQLAKGQVLSKLPEQNVAARAVRSSPRAARVSSCDADSDGPAGAAIGRG
jgi:hypothetical protein